MVGFVKPIIYKNKEYPSEVSSVKRTKDEHENKDRDCCQYPIICSQYEVFEKKKEVYDQEQVEKHINPS
jgi:hypothetical protein